MSLARPPSLPPSLPLPNSPFSLSPSLSLSPCLPLALPFLQTPPGLRPAQHSLERDPQVQQLDLQQLVRLSDEVAGAGEEGGADGDGPHSHLGSDSALDHAVMQDAVMQEDQVRREMESERERERLEERQRQRQRETETETERD